MRILLAHNEYSSKIPSGENIVFRLERDLLRTRGHDVIEFLRSNDEIVGRSFLGPLKAGACATWNPRTTHIVHSLAKDKAIDVMHVHNTFPLISPSIFYALRETSVARVLTLHNYRLYCAAAIPMRNGKVCTECLDKHSSLPSIEHGCYRNSRLATAPLALSISIHRLLKTWQNQVDAFIALTEFQKKIMISAGLPEHKVHVKPNFYPTESETERWEDREPYIVFAGRLGEEKGVRTLIRAWQAWGSAGPELRIIGDGPLKQELQDMAKDLPIRFYGYLPAPEVQAQIKKSHLQVLPSECYEGFPMTICEAFAGGTPSAVSDIGPLPSIVTHGKNGLIFKPFDPSSLLDTIRTAWETPGLLKSLGESAHIEFKEKYNKQASYTRTMEIYNIAMQVAAHRNN